MEDKYRQLQRKLNTIGIGLPETDDGYELNYLRELYNEDEVEFALKMPVGLHTAEEFAADMQLSLAETDRMLRSMADRNLLFRLHEGDTLKYYLLPAIHGFIEFNLNRFSYNLARNFSKHYMKGMGARFMGTKEPIFRVLPLNRALVEDDACLPCDDVEAIIRRQEKIALCECFCRKSTQANPKATGCKNNPDFSRTCMAFGIFAEFYVENGMGEYITTEEALEHMKVCARDGNTVEVLNTTDVEVMCSCCACCCGVLKAMQIFGGQAMKLASNYKISHSDDACVSCGACVERCNLNALRLENGRVVVNPELCMGCGQCASICPAGAMKLFRKAEEELYTPPRSNVLELYDYVRAERRRDGEF